MLKTKVKATAVTNLTDARYFAAWEAEWLGFNLNSGDESYIAPHEMKAIKEWVDGVKIIGEFDIQTAEDIIESVDLLELDGVQVGTFADSHTLQLLHQQEIPVIKEIVLTEIVELDQLEEQLSEQSTYVENFLLNFDKNGMHWKDLSADAIAQLEKLSNRYPILLSIGHNGEELLNMLEHLSITGISVRGGEEEKVGFKSYEDLDDIFEALEVFEE